MVLGKTPGQLILRKAAKYLLLVLLMVATAFPAVAGSTGGLGAAGYYPQFGRRRMPMPKPGGGGPGARNNQVKKQQLRARVMQAIGLTPEQRQRMQQIQRDHEEERIVAGRRLREARRALDRAIMSERYDEVVVKRATDELANAQADRIRIESRVRSQIRGVLTTEQINRFHQLEREMRREMREQQNQREQERDERQLDELDLLEKSRRP
jgi:Spy/CpxP family protein refolding chaperone